MKKGMVYSGTFMAILLRPGGPRGRSRPSGGSPRRCPGRRRRCCSGRWRSRWSRRSSRPSTAARRSSAGSARAIGTRSSTPGGRWSGWAWGWAIALGIAGRSMPAPGRVRVRRRAWRRSPGSTSLARRVRGVAGPGPGPVVAGLPGPGAAGRVHRRGDRVLLRRGAGRRGGRQVPPLPRRRARPPEPFDVRPLLSKWGFIDLGTSHRRRQAPVRRGAGRGDRAGRSRPGCSRSTGRSWRPTSSKEPAPIRALFTRDGLVELDPEHDRGPPLGPLDVADHQVVPPADGRPDLVQPGRRDPDRAGHLPRRHDRAPTPSAPGASSVFIYLLAYDCGPRPDLARPHGPAGGHAGQPELPGDGPARRAARPVPRPRRRPPGASPRGSSGSPPGPRS